MIDLFGYKLIFTFIKYILLGKKVFILLFTFLYLMATSGIAVSIHYCGGEVDSFEFYSGKQKKCCCKDSADNKSCCNDEIKQLKSDPSDIICSGIKFIKVPIVRSDQYLFLSKHTLDFINSFLSFITVNYRGKIPLYLQIGVLLI